MTQEEIRQKIREYKDKGLKLFATSSYQSHSIPLVHMLSEIDKEIPIMFINTGYLFPETIEFKDRLAKAYGQNVLDVRSTVPKSHQRDSRGNLYFTSDTDRCCFLNKTQPMEPILKEYDVWINGVRADQNLNRRNMRTEQQAPHDCLRFHPILDWDSKMIHEYRQAHDLPLHPLEAKGYLSIGCQPCTSTFDMETERGARWFGQSKTECGLHTELVSK